jgi:hypothetical protein
VDRWYRGLVPSYWWTEPIPLTDVGGVWVFPDQGVLYTETTIASPTAEDANALVDFFLWLDQQLASPRRLTVVHDWRSFVAIPREVRRTFIDRRKELVRRPARVVIAVTMNPMIRMAIQTVSLGAQFLVRAPPLDLVHDVAPVLRDLGVRDPDPSLHARLRLAWRHAKSGSPP